MQNTGKLKYRLDTGQASLALTQGQLELHKLDLDTTTGLNRKMQIVQNPILKFYGVIELISTQNIGLTDHLFFWGSLKACCDTLMFIKNRHLYNSVYSSLVIIMF